MERLGGGGIPRNSGGHKPPSAFLAASMRIYFWRELPNLFAEREASEYPERDHTNKKKGEPFGSPFVNPTG